MAASRAKPGLHVAQGAQVQTPDAQELALQRLNDQHCPEWCAAGTPRPSGPGDTLQEGG